MRENGSMSKSNIEELNPSEQPDTVDIGKSLASEPMPEVKVNEAEIGQQEIARLVESINLTKAGLNEAREKLGLPPTEEDPPSVQLEKDKLEELIAQQRIFSGKTPDEIREGQEQPDLVMETARIGRTGLLKDIVLSRTKNFVTSPLFLKALNYVPVIADVGLASGTLLGKEGARKISAGERLCYAAAFGMAVLSYFHAYEGNLTAAGADTIIINAIMSIDTAPIVLKKAAATLEQKSPKIAHMMDAVADFLLQKREQLVNLKKSLGESPIVLSPEANTP